jgi:hypothetical protein
MIAPILTPVILGSPRHLELIGKGYRTHHVDGRIAYLETPSDRNPLGLPTNLIVMASLEAV